MLGRRLSPLLIYRIIRAFYDGRIEHPLVLPLSISLTDIYSYMAPSQFHLLEILSATVPLKILPIVLIVGEAPLALIILDHLTCVIVHDECSPEEL